MSSCIHRWKSSLALEMIIRANIETIKWAKIIASYHTHHWLIARNYTKLNTKKIQVPINNWANNLKKLFSKQEHKCQITTLRIVRYSSRRGKSKLLCVSLSCQSEWLSSKSLTTNTGDDLKRKKSLFALGGGCILMQSLWKSGWSHLKH